MSKLDADATFTVFGVIILIIVLLVLLFGSGLFQDLKEQKVMQNEFCKERGYDKATDIRYYRIGGIDMRDIECDGETIFKYNVIEKDCIEKDKWDECSDYKYKIGEYIEVK